MVFVKSYVKQDGTRVSGYISSKPSSVANGMRDCDATLVGPATDVAELRTVSSVHRALAVSDPNDDDLQATLGAAGVSAAIREAAEDDLSLAGAASVTLENINDDGGAPYLSVLSIENAAGDTIWPPKLRADYSPDELYPYSTELADELLPDFAVLLDRRMGRLVQRPYDKHEGVSWTFPLNGHDDALGFSGRDAIYDGLVSGSNDAEFTALAHVAELLGVQWDESADGSDDDEDELHTQIRDALSGPSDDDVRTVLSDLAGTYRVDYTDYYDDDDDD